MNFLEFKRGDVPLEPPRRAYGRVDSVEPENLTPDSPYWIYFECVDADWFDSHFDQSLWSPQQILKCPVSVIEFSLSGGLPAPPGIPLDEGKWIELELSDDPTPNPLNQYLNLFAAPLRRYLVDGRIVSPELERKLDASASMDDLPDAELDSIRNLLASISKTKAAVVADVGQGNCNGLLDDEGVVSVYFDLGGGVLANRHTFPIDMSGLCFSNHPPVILSHWDWDHWSSAQRFTSALDLTWIVPRQLIGHVHRQFLGNLQRNGQVLVWPNNLPTLSVDHLTIEKCTGSGRNHSGLALVVAEPVRNSTQRMLFPGDSRYTAIPSHRVPNNTAIVVPHHGGNMRSSYVAETLGASHSRLVYSAGHGNTYNHPSQTTMVSHAKKWAVHLETKTRSAIQSGVSGLGNVHLYWDSAAPNVHPGCGATYCSLCHVQR